MVDDHRDARAELAGILESAGHGVLLAGSVIEALEHLHRTTTDIVVAEIRMPAMSGLEAIKAIRRRDPTIFIISISGNDGGLPAHTALTLARAFGTDRVIYRPYLPGELLAMLRRPG